MTVEDRIREKREVAEHLTAIRSLPSWQIVRDRVLEQRIRRDLKAFTAPVELTYQKIDYGRGFIAGIQYVIRAIEDGEKTLREALELTQEQGE